jgi:hypothetical protein
MEELTHPVVLSDEELDLVAAGWSEGRRSSNENSQENTQAGLVNFNNTNIGVNVLGFQHQSAGNQFAG